MVGQVRHGSKGGKPTSTAADPQAGDAGPIPIDILVPILNYLFPDAEGQDQTAPYPSTLSPVPEWPAEEGQSGEHPLKVIIAF